MIRYEYNAQLEITISEVAVWNVSLLVVDSAQLRLLCSALWSCKEERAVSAGSRRHSHPMKHDRQLDLEGLA